MDAARLLAAYRHLADDPPPSATTSTAIAELLHALELHAERVNGWFPVGSPKDLSPHPRAAITRLLLERVPSFGRLARAAVAVARATTLDDFDTEWGMLLAAAFPERDGVLRGGAHRRLVYALLDNPALEVGLFERLALFGLPKAREACVAALGHRPFGGA